jgi:conjugative transfer signal peptidase TraF
MRGKGIALGLSVFAAGSLGQLAGIRINHSPSMPRGAWLEQKPTGRAYKVGDIVAVCPPLVNWQKRYLDPGTCPNRFEPMLKPVAAIEGDLVVIASDGIWINFDHIPDSVPLVRDGQGRALPAIPPGRYPVDAGQVWLIVPRADSFDSRYLGPVSTDTIVGFATPVLVWR